jgi:hypothetical protein
MSMTRRFPYRELPTIFVFVGAAITAACSSSSTGGSSGSGTCAQLAACCPAVDQDACKALTAEGNQTNCGSAVQVYCGEAPGSGSGSAGGSGTGSSGDAGGTETFSCYEPKNGEATLPQCTNYKNVDSSTAAGLTDNCNLQKGTIGTGCPTAKLVGCCTQTSEGASQETCYYSGSPDSITTADVMSDCSGGGPPGTFSATP